MDKIRLGIDSGTTTFLHDTLQREFDIKFNPSVTSYGKSVDISIDAFLLIDGEVNNYSKNLIKYCNVLKIPVMGFNRLDKSLQSLYLNKFNITTPDTYFYYQDDIVKMHSENLLNVLSEISDDTKVVMKMQQGARGIGQMLTTKADLINLMCSGLGHEDEYGPKVESYDSPNNKDLCPLDPNKYKLGNDGWCHHLKSRICSGTDYIVQEYKEIEEEYRLLYFYGEEPIVIERQVGKDGHWQANSCITGYSKEVSERVINKDLLEKINNLGKHLNAPFMSTDVYKTKDGEWGLLEFQSEFGFKDVPPTKLYKRLNDSVYNMYCKLK